MKDLAKAISSSSHRKGYYYTLQYEFIDSKQEKRKVTLCMFSTPEEAKAIKDAYLPETKCQLIKIECV
ncbi:MAG: hypothetical protein II453_11815 [Alphaproteobacteria bacterium]|nr:hypothetical protein [Alphaproteobacteria bacterium]MBQ3945468.1 hypothetical protein [Alphaproteobacteria bacterium]